MSGDFKFHDEWGPERVLKVYDPKIGLKGILVIDNTKLGPGKGGIRMAAGITEEEVFRLARTMTWKNALAGIPFGGAKAGIIYPAFASVDKKATAGKDKKVLMQGFARAIKEYLPEQYIAGPDVNTGEAEMAWFIQAVKNKKAATGKPKKLGGLPHELGSTGFGVAHSVKAAAQILKIDITRATVAIEGFGNVGSFAFKHLSEMGAKIVAVADSRDSIYSDKGLDYEKLVSLKAAHKPVGEYQNVKKMMREAIFAVPVDILVLATVTDVITDKNKNAIQAKLIVEGSNIPMRERVENELFERGIAIIPDFVANAGGVISSYAEYRGWGAERMFELVKSKINQTTKMVLEASLKKKRNPRAVAMEIAMARVKRA